jgi:hypothetical protein
VEVTVAVTSARVGCGVTGIPITGDPQATNKKTLNEMSERIFFTKILFV